MPCCALALALFAPLVVGSPTPTDAPIDQPAAQGQITSRVAIGASGEALAVWVDGRFGEAAIVGARIDFGPGEIADPRGIEIAREGAQPDVAFDGTSYLVVYQGDGGSDGTDILARRVTNGVVDATPIIVDAGTGLQRTPRVAYDGTHYMFVWEDANGGNRIRARAMSPDGTFAGGPIDVSTTAMTTPKYAPAIAASASGFVIAWEEARTAGNATDVFARALTAAGTLGTELAVSATTFDERRPSIAWNGTTFLVSFTSTTVTTGKDILARLVTAAGTSGGSVFAVTAAPGDQTTTHAIGQTAGTTEFLVTYVDESNMFDVRGTRVSSAGSVLDAAMTPGFGVATGAASYEGEPAGCPLPSGGFAVVFSERADITVGVDVWVKVVSSDGTVAGNLSTVVSGAVNSQQRPSIAHGSSGYLVAWEDNRGTSVSSLWGLLLDASGDALGAPFELQGSQSSALDAPHVAYASGAYHVVWESSGNLFVRSYDENTGAALGAATMFVSSGGETSASNVQVASNGTDVLVTYTWSSGSAQVRSFVLPAGAPPIAPPNSVLENGFAGVPVATEGGWLVPGATFAGAVRVVRLAADGSVLDTYLRDDITDTMPVVAVTGATALLAWAGIDQLVHVRSFDPGTGTVGASELVLGATGSYVRAMPLTQGVALVTWEQPTGDLAAARIDAATLARIDTNDAVLVSGALDAYEPAVDVDGQGAGVLAWTVRDTSATANSLRVRYATLAGLAATAEVPDAGASDGGATTGEGDDSGGGCCQANRNDLPMVPLLLVVLGLALRRRRTVRSALA